MLNPVFLQNQSIYVKLHTNVCAILLKTAISMILRKSLGGTLLFRKMYNLMDFYQINGIILISANFMKSTDSFNLRDPPCNSQANITKSGYFKYFNVF